MSSTRPEPTGVICDDREALRHRVHALLVRCGISVVGEADGFVPLLTLVLRTRPALAVITLPLAGTSGFTAVSAVRAAAPECQVVLLSALGNLELAAHDAGAYAVLPENDPQALQAVLQELVDRLAQPASDTVTTPSDARVGEHYDAAADRPVSSASSAGPASSTTNPPS